MNRQEWLEARKNGLGGSDAACALGLNPWKTNVELWEEKTGRREPEDISEKEAVLYGSEAEQHMRELFKLDYPKFRVEHEENTIIQHPEHPFLQASLDGLLYDTDGAKGILEIKTCTIQNGGEWAKWDNRIPPHYFLQVLHYMNVTGATFAIVKARLRSDWSGGLKIFERHYRYERDDDIQNDIDYLQEKEIAFWKMVETDKRPDLILPEI